MTTKLEELPQHQQAAVSQLQRAIIDANRALKHAAAQGLEVDLDYLTIQTMGWMDTRIISAKIRQASLQII